MKLRTIKFDDTLKNKTHDRIIEEQDKIYKKYKFYDGFIKAKNKNQKN